MAEIVAFKKQIYIERDIDIYTRVLQLQLIILISSILQGGLSLKD